MVRASNAKKINDSRLLRIQLPGNPCCIGLSGEFEKFRATFRYNAWRAGVPAILGSESAFQGERKSKLDYIEVKSTAEIMSALKRLKEDAEYRKAMVENGKKRARKVSTEAITGEWRKLFSDVVTPAFLDWYSLPVSKKNEYFMRKNLSYLLFRFSKMPRLIRNRLAIRTRVKKLISDVWFF